MTEGNGTKPNQKAMTIIVTKGSLDWAYPPFILATTAAAMGVNTTMFFTFYGLPLLLKKLDLKISPMGNPAMKMPMAGMHMGMPNWASAIPGVDSAATSMMKDMIKKKGVASIEELRDMALEADVRMIACQMTMDLFEYKKDDMIDGLELGGAATYMEQALQSQVESFHLSSLCTSTTLKNSSGRNYGRQDARRERSQLSAANSEDKKNAHPGAGRRHAGSARDRSGLGRRHGLLLPHDRK